VKRRFICLVQIKGRRMSLMESFNMSNTIENNEGKCNEQPRSSHVQTFVEMTMETVLAIIYL